MQYAPPQEQSQSKDRGCLTTWYVLTRTRADLTLANGSQSSDHVLLFSLRGGLRVLLRDRGMLMLWMLVAVLYYTFV